MSNAPIIVQRPDRTKFWIRFILITLFMAFLYIVAFTQTELASRTQPGQATMILRRLFWEPFFTERVLEQVPMYLGFMMETVAIAYAGTLIGSILAIPVGFLAAANVANHLSVVGKSILNAIRAFPEIMFAIIFVSAVGMGPFAGVLAIGINSIGMLGKLYSEVIESIDMEVVGALKATGANRVQVMWFGILPQVIPEFSSYALYRYEIDVRSSSVLGIVGAGGIGAPIILASNQRNWEAVGMMLIIIIVTVTIIDIVSSSIRRRLV